MRDLQSDSGSAGSAWLYTQSCFIFCGRLNLLRNLPRTSAAHATRISTLRTDRADLLIRSSSCSDLARAMTSVSDIFEHLLRCMSMQSVGQGSRECISRPLEWGNFCSVLAMDPILLSLKLYTARRSSLMGVGETSDRVED